MSDADKTVLILDGNSLTYRAFYGIPTDMVTASGQVTNAVYGMTSMLLTLLKDHRPSGIIVAFDRPEPTFRHIAEPSYKAQREANPDILRQQMGIVKELLTAMGVTVTGWDMAETASGGPFPEVLQHEIFLNCILARPGCPVFVPASAKTDPRTLTVIGDIACDPTSDFSPIKVYDRATDWDAPALRVHDAPPLDVTAIDNLPSLLPVESSQDYAAQLLPSLLTLTDLQSGVWGRAKTDYDRHVATV